MIAGLFLYVLMYVGFLIVAWITNGFFSHFRKDDYTLLDSVATLAVFGTLYGVYTYFMAEWLH